MREKYPYAEAKEFLKEFMARKGELTRGDIRKNMSMKFGPRPAKEMQPRLVAWLAAEYIFISGPSKKMDKFTMNLDTQPVYHSGTFLCPRCKKTHAMDFKNLSGTRYYAYCANTLKPVMMTLD